MRYSSQILEKLIVALSRLPGIGEKSAQRIALYLLQESREEGEALANAILDLQEKVIICSVCFNISDDDQCLICRDTKRDRQIICVVEEPKDLMAISFPRSSLLRMGAFVQNGVWDAGFKGKSEIILVVENPKGIKLKENARITQVIFIEINKVRKGYQGIYLEKKNYKLIKI